MLYFIEEKQFKDRIEKFGLCEDMDQVSYQEVKEELFSEEVEWQKNQLLEEAAHFPYVLEVEECFFKIRLNQTVNAPLYTLLIDNQPIFSFDELPENWSIDD